MAKYDFKKIETDKFQLNYVNKDGVEKTIEFKRTIELAKRISSLDAEAHIKMYRYLTEKGLTKKDFCVEVKAEDGSIKIDETNYREFEQEFLQQANYELTNDMFKLTLGMDLITLLQEINFKNDKEAFMFTSKFRAILNGEANEEEKTPSGNIDEQLPTPNGEKQ